MELELRWAEAAGQPGKADGIGSEVQFGTAPRFAVVRGYGFLSGDVSAHPGAGQVSKYLCPISNNSSWHISK